MIRNLSGRQASKTITTFDFHASKFETSQADRHRKLHQSARPYLRNSKPLRPTGIENTIAVKFDDVPDSKPLRPTGIENGLIVRCRISQIRNLSGRQASKTYSLSGSLARKFETSQADRHRKHTQGNVGVPRYSKPLRPTGIENLVKNRVNFLDDSKPLRPTGIENNIPARRHLFIIRNLSGRQASKTRPQCGQSAP